MIALLSPEQLQQQYRFNLWMFSPLTLSLEYFLSIYQHNRETHFLNNNLCEEYLTRWKSEILDSLLEKVNEYDLLFSGNLGHWRTDNLLTLYMREWLPISEPIIEVTDKVLANTKLKWSIVKMAHELGHLVEHMTVNLASVLQNNLSSIKFSNALAEDLKNLDKEKCDPYFKGILYRLDQTNVRDVRLNHEWFTILFFEFPCDFVLSFPQKTEADLMALLNRDFPKTLA